MKKNIDHLYEMAYESLIFVDEECPEEIVSMSIKFPNGFKAISLPQKNNESAEQKKYTKLECFAHEMGHCATDSFYTRDTSYRKRLKHEYRANKWAIDYLIPFDELSKAVNEGNRELWQLAEYFDVGEPFVEKAIIYHAQHGRVVELRAKF